MDFGSKAIRHARQSIHVVEFVTLCNIFLDGLLSTFVSRPLGLELGAGGRRCWARLGYGWGVFPALFAFHLWILVCFAAADRFLGAWFGEIS